MRRFLFLAVLLLLLAGGGLAAKEFFMLHGTQGVFVPPPMNAVPTFTFQNDSGGTLPAGTPVSFGMAFRYGDVPAGSYPQIRDASTHIPLAGQQWDEISTWRENGGNGSWRHAVWATWLPNSLASGATYQVEFIPTVGSPPAAPSTALLISPGNRLLVNSNNILLTSANPISALCSGPAAHDLKIHLTDVRNQNDTVRDSGDATFRLCDNIANVGRDAPRQVRAGNVYKEYIVSGLFVYAPGTGNVSGSDKDPLLYAQCNVDIFTQASDGISAGDVRWVCHVHNSWENVAAGSIGNVGNPGPAGFTNDPQTITYRAEIDDGASDVLDWSGLDATVTSASNPIKPDATLGCDTTAGANCMLVSSSTGANQWYYGQATRVNAPGTAFSGTPVAGLTAGQLYFAYPGSSVLSSNTVTTGVQLMLGTNDLGTFPMTSSQGTGTTTFSTRIPHYHWSSWQTLDATGQDNWAPFGTTSRVTRKVYPAFTAAEKRYWEETGLVIPLNLAQGTNIQTTWNQALGPNYEPYGRLNVIGGDGTGTRNDLGISSEWAAQAFISGTQHDWDNAHLFTLGTSTHGTASLLNEATGRVPPLNNGPPTGAGGNGAGGSYAGLGAPQPLVTLDQGGSCLGSLSGHIGEGLADPPHNLPNASFPTVLGQWGCGTDTNHMPSFDGFTYAVFGDRHFLDVMRWHGNQMFLQQRAGPGPSLGQGYYRDNNAKFTDGNTYHYYGLLIDCCQTRGSAWMFRDIIYPATFGSDNDIERSYFHDFLVENGNYYPLWLAFKDNAGLSTNTNYSTSIMTPDAPGQSIVPDTFQTAYVASVAWLMTTFLHEPLGSQWMTKYQRFYEGVMGGQLPGAPVSFYAIDFSSEYFIHNGDDGTLTSQSEPNGVGNFGPSVNGTDASDFGAFSAFTSILTGGQLAADNRYTYTAGDFLKPITAYPLIETPKLDQLNGNTWYKIIGPINNNLSQATFFLQCPATQAAGPGCPTPGAAFTFFSRGGVTINNEHNSQQYKYRLQFDPGPGNGYADVNYNQYGGQTLSALKILGYSIPHALADFASRDGGNTIGAASPGGYYNPGLPSNWWDQTVVIPGLPAAVNGLTGTSIACDVGPSYTGSIPSGAQAAGFTHCAANYDFTTSNNFTFGGNTFNFANVSSWFSCTTGSGASNPHPLWMQNSVAIGGSGEVPCGNISIVSDGAAPQVLKLVVDQTNPPPNITTIGTAEQGCASSPPTNPGGCWGLFPTTNLYAEVVFRYDPTAITNYSNNGTNVGFDFWSFGLATAYPEIDFIENFGTGTVHGSLTFNGNAAPYFINYPFDNNYHTVGTLVTANPSTALVSMCEYLDGVANSSAGGTSNPGTCAQKTANSGQAQNEGYLILWNAYNAVATPGGPIPIYIKSIRVWTCAGWNNTTPPTFTNSSSNTCSTATPYATPP